ncbi:MAG: ImmA/IrrE family metallo-endopeptidase [Melioribacteraceae bacterium]
MASNLKIEKVASEFRIKCGYNTLSPIRIKSLLQQLNVLTIFREMGESFSGMSIKIDDDKFMLINSAHSVGRQHFTIFHELYHLFIQDNFEHVICEDKMEEKLKKDEKEADKFAAYLLLPREGVLNLIPENELKKNKIELNTIIALEQYYSCSHSAMLIRLEDLDLIDSKKRKELSINISKEAKNYGYDISLYLAGNEGLIIGDYGAKAKRLFENEKISYSHYLTLMKDIGIELEFERF